MTATMMSDDDYMKWMTALTKALSAIVSTLPYSDGKNEALKETEEMQRILGFYNYY